jgi:hypothetical protein
MNEIYAVLFAVVVFSAYCLYTVKKLGKVSTSISTTYNKIGYSSLYTGTMGLTAMAMMYAGGTLLSITAGALLLMCGIASTTNTRRTEVIHIIGATGCMALGMASLWLDFAQWYLVLPFIVFTIYCVSGLNGQLTIRGRLIHVPNHTWWIECAAMGVVSLGLTIKSI